MGKQISKNLVINMILSNSNIEYTSRKKVLDEVVFVGFRQVSSLFHYVVKRLLELATYGNI